MKPSPEVLEMVVVFLVGSSLAFDIRYCDEPLGMESGAIPDKAITASSSYVPNVGPKNGRLRIEKAGGGWCPKQQVERGIKEYLQVNLEDVHLVTGIQTQGRYDRGRGQEYAEEYTVEYWRPGLEDWVQYKRWDGKTILRGNSDTATVESHRLMPPIFANKVRILPYSVHRRTVCLRTELLGCLYDGGVLWYSAPEGSEPSFADTSYDGGLGRLTDGETGADNFRLDIGYGKGTGWIGWNNSSLENAYVELIFQFDQVRNLTSVDLYANNYFSKDVQVFSTAKLSFSIGGEYYNGRTLTYNYMPDMVLENARNVSIQLHNRLARFIKMRLFFAARWIMLSEVVFNSVPVAFNVSDEETPEIIEDELVITSLDNTINDPFEAISARKDGNSYVEIIVGVLTAIMLLLLIVFVIILAISRRHKFQGSPALFRNAFRVKINMKDLLMNFSSSTNATTSNSHPNQELPNELPPSILEQYGSPLMNSYYAQESGPVRCSASIQEHEEPPEVPPLPSVDCLESPQTVDPPSSYYGSLQTTPDISPKSNMINLINYFPKIVDQLPVRKLYLSTPREKQRQSSPPRICWNIAPSMGYPYKCKEAELVPIPRYCLSPFEKIGSCHAGETTLYETEGLDDIIPGVGRLVAVRTPSNYSASASLESLREVRFLASLSDANICKILGICTAEQPPWTIIEYGEMGELAQYLQFIASKSETTRSSVSCPLSFGCLAHMATQIACGMKYLESKHVVHKDLAARNCLVGHGYIVKVTDIAMCKPQYRKDYAEIGGRPPAPIRWLPWESILLDRYSCSSSVWAFAVTLWEILNFATERPFQNLTNEKVIQNAEHMYYGGELQVMLNKPPMCSSELYELMCQCWRRDDAARPTFKQIHLFLTHSNKDYSPSD